MRIAPHVAPRMRIVEAADAQSVTVLDPDAGSNVPVDHARKTYTVDAALPGDASQEDVYDCFKVIGLATEPESSTA